MAQLLMIVQIAKLNHLVAELARARIFFHLADVEVLFAATVLGFFFLVPGLHLESLVNDRPCLL